MPETNSVDSESLRFTEDSNNNSDNEEKDLARMEDSTKDNKVNNWLDLWMLLWIGLAPFGIVFSLEAPASSPNEIRIKWIVSYSLLVSHVAVYLGCSYGKFTPYCGFIGLGKEQRDELRGSGLYLMARALNELGILVMASMASAVWERVSSVPMDPVATTLYQFFHLYMALLIVPVIFTGHLLTFHVVWLKTFNMEMPTRKEILVFLLALFGYLFLFQFVPLLPLAWSSQPMWIIPVSLVAFSAGMRVVSRLLLFSSRTMGSAADDTWARFLLEFRWWSGTLPPHCVVPPAPSNISCCPLDPLEV